MSTVSSNFYNSTMGGKSSLKSMFIREGELLVFKLILFKAKCFKKL